MPLAGVRMTKHVHWPLFDIRVQHMTLEAAVSLASVVGAMLTPVPSTMAVSHLNLTLLNNWTTGLPKESLMISCPLFMIITINALVVFEATSLSAAFHTFSTLIVLKIVALSEVLILVFVA